MKRAKAYIPEYPRPRLTQSDWQEGLSEKSMFHLHTGQSSAALKILHSTMQYDIMGKESRLLGTHQGAYTRFPSDEMAVLNNSGEQRWRSQSYGCWYVQTIGICRR